LASCSFAVYIAPRDAHFPSFVLSCSASKLGDNSFQTTRHLYFGVPTTLVLMIGGSFLIEFLIRAFDLPGIQY
jgi:hypothetical protein